MKQSYHNLSDAKIGLRAEGYSLDFNIMEERIACHARNLLLSPDDFEIEIIYRFDGALDPGDRCILYGLSSTKYDLKGLLVSRREILSGVTNHDIISRLHMDEE